MLPQTVIFIAIFFFFLGGAGGYFGRGLITQSSSNPPNSNHSENPENQNQNYTNGNQNGLDTTQKNRETQKIDIPPEVETTGIENFEKTVQAIQETKTELINQGKTQQVAIQDIKQVLENNGKFILNWGVIEGKLKKETEEYKKVQKQWIGAIYEYQKSKNPQGADGYISPRGGTAQAIIKDIRQPSKPVPPVVQQE